MESIPSLMEVLKELLAMGDLTAELPEATALEFISKEFQSYLESIGSQMYDMKALHEQKLEEAKVLEFKKPMLPGPDTLQ
jgi:hypothetical protein